MIVRPSYGQGADDVESSTSDDSSIVVELELQKDGHIGGTSRSGIDLTFQAFSGLFSNQNLGFFDLRFLRKDCEYLFFRFSTSLISSLL